MTDSELVIERLYALMRERNLTVNRLATLSGVTQSTISSFIYRKGLPKIDLLRVMCKAMHISVRDFFDFPPYNEVEN